MKVIERSVQEIGKSLLVTLPKQWATQVGVKKGTILKLLLSDQGALNIMPEHVAAEQFREVTYEYDEHSKRRFFREYFEGNEKITILLKKITEAERKELYIFLKRFMNLQIIEETDEKIVVKIFKIDELTMRECMDRMHYLSLNLLQNDEDGATTRELRDTMTRFYYMLVMQVRRFLSEGKFASAKHVTLIKSMDFRMVAEKMQRIAQIAIKHQNIEPAAIDYYKRAFQYFRNNEFEKALPLWDEGNKLLKTHEGPSADIIVYAQEIGMLVR